jgi:membrane protease YdiL (CAAX protease family)
MFFAIARTGRNELWRYVISVILIIAVSLIGQIPLTLFLVFRMTGYSDLQRFQEKLDFSEIGIDPNIGLLFMLIPFILCFLCMIFIVKIIHLRPFLSVLTGHGRFNWPKLFFALAVMFLLLLITELALYIVDPDNYELNFNLRLFIPLVIISLCMLPLQTSFEEIFMRGYLMQGIGLIAGYKWIPLVITSVVFGLMHLMNPEIKEFGIWLTIPYYIGFGLLMGIITIMDDGIEIPLGIHAIVNIYGSVLVTFPGSTMQTPALFMMKEYDPVLMSVLFVIISIIFLLIAAKKYKFTCWGKLFEKISYEKKFNQP